MMFDDITNGNATSDGSAFFIGIVKLIEEIGNLNTNMAGVNTELNKLGNGGNMASYVSNVNDASTKVRKVPNNVDADGNLVLTYTVKFN